MKKFLLVAALSLVTTLGFSQGQINFVNTSAAFSPGPARLVTTSGVPGFSDGAGLTGTNYVAQLFLASDFSSVLVEAPSVFRIPTTTQPGTWNGGVRNFLNVPANQPGQTLSLVVRVWDITLGSTYDAARANGSVFGQSAAFSYLIPAAGTPPAGLAMQNFQAFTVTVPEPTTIALGILGAGSLLFLRRKK